ncbi:putative RecA/RadA family phage recombinase [Streptomyces costaricanus]|uniref:Putative RecA/RadA family phage recombinase n=2 Tax=Streptomyces murinus TaxID=33900 RepID=A0A7W3NP94_STRMR|nr:putative RecA/RadA family phage recombinase [Streptomyces murinus]
MSMRRRGTAVGAALVLSGAGALLGLAVTPAQAATVAYATHCVPPAGISPVDGTTQVEITAPATAKVGDTVDVGWKFVQAASKNPDIIDLPANSVQPSGVLKAAGAQSADIAMQGPRQNPAIPKGAQMVLSDMKGSVKLTAPGEVTLTPDAYTVNAMSTDTKCTPKEAVQKSATIKVTAAGGTSTPTPTPTPTPTHSATPTPTPSTSGGTGQTDFTGKEVRIPYACKTPIGDKNATSPVQIDAKKNGGDYALTVRFKESVMDSPADIPAGSVKPSMEVVVGGADKGTVQVAGPANAAPIKSGDPIAIPDLTGTYKPGATGSSTLSPGVLTVNALGTTTTCTPTGTQVSLTLDTTGQAGGTSGGSSTSGGSTGGTSTTTSGGLADTGASDHGTLKALGLVAGTAILLGGAIFTFMPRRRTR